MTRTGAARPRSGPVPDQPRPETAPTTVLPGQHGYSRCTTSRRRTCWALRSCGWARLLGTTKFPAPLLTILVITRLTSDATHLTLHQRERHFNVKISPVPTTPRIGARTKQQFRSPLRPVPGSRRIQHDGALEPCCDGAGSRSGSGCSQFADENLTRNPLRRQPSYEPVERSARSVLSRSHATQPGIAGQPNRRFQRRLFRQHPAPEHSHGPQRERKRATAGRP